MTAVLANA